MKEFTRVMKALSDPNRVKIVKLLERRSLCVCELQAALGIAQPTVSSHLKVLEDALQTQITRSRRVLLFETFEGGAISREGNKVLKSVVDLAKTLHQLKNPATHHIPGQPVQARRGPADPEPPECNVLPVPALPWP